MNDEKKSMKKLPLKEDFTRKILLMEITHTQKEFVKIYSKKFRRLT